MITSILGDSHYYGSGENSCCYNYIVTTFLLYLSMLKFSTAHIAEKFRKMPMALITLAFIAGVVLAAYTPAGVVAWVVLLCVALAVTIFWRKSIFVALMALGGLVFNLYRTSQLPVGQSVRLVMEVADDGNDYGSYSTCAADVIACNGVQCRARVRITADSLLLLRSGDVLCADVVVRPFKSDNSSYARSMYRQGFSGRVSVGYSSITEFIPASSTTLHRRAVERIEALIPPSDGRDVALSVGLGARAIRDRAVATSYSRSGASHLLAVSGMHVAVVFVLLNLLLLPLSLFWRGNIVRAVAVVAMVWLYVALCGYPTSAIRAAIMFSVLQLSYISKSRHLPENSLFATAFIMLATNPYMLFELSFSLSFVAVMAIIFVARPVIDFIACRGFVVKGVVDMVVVSTACVVATAPLISNCFGVFSVLSIFITPVALVTAQVIIVCTIASLVLPTSVATITAQAAAWCGELQNSIVEWTTQWGVGYANLQIGDVAMEAIYAAMALLLVVSFGVRVDVDTKK